MKESRLIMIILIVFSICLLVLFFVLNSIYPSAMDYYGIATNIYCGVIVGFVTSLCQYYSAKHKIINTIYGLYFDIYRLYYVSKAKPFLWHYNSVSINKKLEELVPKINESLDDYHGFFLKKDKTYYKLNPTVKLSDCYRYKYLKKSLFCWFNKEYFDKIYGSFINDIKCILININKRRFIKDEKDMINLYKQILGDVHDR